MYKIEDIINKVHQADCLDFMKQMPDKSVDLVLTDPPYFLDWKEPIKFNDRKDMFHHKEETLKWDSNEDVRLFYSNLLKEFNRIIKETGSIIIFSKTEFITYLYEEGKKNDFDYKATMCWHKTNPMIQIRKKNYVSSIEFISWLARKREKIEFTFNFLTQNEMHNFIEMPICGGNERWEHPTQKPLKLIEKLVKIHSNTNDIIIDPFLGSGTTAVAAKQLKRNFIGIEKEEKYCEISRQRLRQELLF